MIMNKTELLLNEGWKFHFGECEEAWYQGYDDRAFSRCPLPRNKQNQLQLKKIRI